MRIFLFFLAIVSFSFLPQKSFAQPADSIAKKVANMQAFPGFFNFYWDENAGKIWLEIDKTDYEFLYVNSLPAGIGSNDIGLDRGQLGRERVVRFFHSGNKILLIQTNYDYRADSPNPDERKSVEEAFAQSVLWGFKIEARQGDRFLVDATDFILNDAHQVALKLKKSKQGTYKLNPGASAIYLPRTKNFPENTEFEAILTFAGEPQHEWIRSVAPSPESVTVREHHSFVKLPDDKYRPRPFDPRCGFGSIRYQDYATPIGTPLTQRFIIRHRLEKKNPGAAKSEPVEPIIYYVDRGAPEPVKSALMEGASWWNQAFEAAGYINAFQVRELPPDADPMDVRYNLIQWVHRSTRGWSYGASVVDPRTGEIIKGHVSLGSLRVRQDFLIAQGLLPAYEKDGRTPDPQLLEMALARLRQLAAHEVGHTLGLAHNFAASVNNRASVMDYPHPYIELKPDGTLDFSKAYDDKIGEWDKRTILYGYQDFPAGTDESAELQNILKENIARGFLFISDRDARPAYGAHPFAHLWDNGTSAVEELERLKILRKTALKNFGPDNIPIGSPMADLERVLVPVYLMHRYQVEAAAKLIGGVNYAYAVRGDGQPTNEPVAESTQRQAAESLIGTLTPEFLAFPPHIIALIPPQPLGYERDRELFKTKTGLTFDPFTAAESSANHTLDFLLNPERLARLEEQYARSGGKRQFNTQKLIGMLFEATSGQTPTSPMNAELSRMVEKLLVQHLIQLAGNPKINQQVAAIALESLQEAAQKFARQANTNDPQMRAHYKKMVQDIELFKKDPAQFKMPATPKMPAGSPIGCEMENWIYLSEH
ncbi:MAG: DUF5117 domain-containing protein [Bacteroidetes bacterium]|nr:MAG: DUF5117 domain-containing protein [Bacteroidota bacterium]